MNPSKVVRDNVHRLTDLPNVGPAMARDLELLGITTPRQLAGKDPVELYEALCRKTGLRQDPCVLDVFISVLRFVDGEDAKPWWFYTEERKNMLAKTARLAPNAHREL
ncbi:MAG: helix-hairpin-helix domain-containing protein [bacterium]|nr:helix-hairpin-helix domain-containing protein [bacterium]